MKRDKIDISAKVSKLAEEEMCDRMRTIAYYACDMFPRCNTFCEHAKKCVDSPMRNYFWRELANLN